MNQLPIIVQNTVDIAMSDQRVDLHILKGFTNVFLLTSPKSAILIDTGSKSNFKRIAVFLENLDLKFRDLKLIVATHCHKDHVASLAAVKEKSGAKVLAHSAAKEFLAKGEPSYPKGTNPISAATSAFSEAFLQKVYRYPPVEPEITISEDADLSEYGVQVSVLCTPGHSADSISIIVNRESALVGDTIFNVLSAIVYPPWADDTDELLRSMRKLIDTGCKVFYPSHGLPVSVEKLSAILRRKESG